MRQGNLLSLVLAVVLAATGCATQGPREQSGMVIGAVAGGLLGAAISDGTHHHGRYYYHDGDGVSAAAVLIGALAGAAIGGSIGRYMDETDRLYAGNALENVRTGVPSTWRNPDTGYEYEITPTRTYDTASGPCREYTLEAMIGGKAETVYGTACRQPDGSWEIRR